MRSYILQRIFRTLVTLVIFETLIFFFIMAIPGSDFRILPPEKQTPKQVVVQPPVEEGEQTPVAEVVKTEAPTICKVEVEIPKWLPEEDKAKYLEDANRDMILQGCPTGEEAAQTTVPEPPAAAEQQPVGEVYVAPTDSVFQQYIYYWQNLIRGDLGVSTTRRMQVVDVLTELAPRTLILILPGAIIGFILGLRLGISIAWKRGGLQEMGSTVAGVSLFTAFPPFLGFLLATIFAYQLNWLPRENIIDPNLWLGTGMQPNQVIGWMLVTILIDSILIYGLWRFTRWEMKRRTLFRAVGSAVVLVLTAAWWLGNGYGPFLWDILRHLVLPLSTLILLTFGTTMLLMRASMADVLQDAHVTTAKAKGLPDQQVSNKHVARLAMIPVVSRFLLELPLVIISSFAIERVFYWNGLGQYLFQATNESDYMLVLGILTVVGIVILAAHFFVDMLNLVLDPRLRKMTKSAKGE